MDFLNPATRILGANALWQARKAARQRNWPAAERHYRTLIRCNPNQASAYVQLGHALLEQGFDVAALSAYSHAAMLSPADHDIHMHVGHALKQQGQRTQAFLSYLSAWRAKPGFDDAAIELRALRPWIDDNWLEAAKHGDPAWDAERYCEIRTALSKLIEPHTLEESYKASFQFLAGCIECKE